MAHPLRHILERYAAGTMAAAECAELQPHLLECPDCREIVAQAMADWSGETLSPQWKKGSKDSAESGEHSGESPIGEVTVGTLIGRYVVIGHLGQGAMGQVLAAFDPRLERKVALKLLRSNAPAVGNAALRARLVREAKVLAQLTHPNVVHVHDVGDYGDSIFIAMDLVEGTTLSRWLAGGPHSWREVLPVFLMAGRGLAAAHAANLVHRDFKPDNVLVGRDGVVRVTDFGVARRVKERTPAADEESLSGRSSLIGTPAYMSPEQLDGHPADGRSDQFSFCVSLFEALHGRRPFDGDTLEQLRNSVGAGTIIVAVETGKVPGWLHAAILKGLSTRAEDRFASMDALLAVLARGLERRGTRSLLAVAVALTALAASGLVGREVLRRRTDPCHQAPARVRAVWNEARKPGMQQAFIATGLPFAADSVASVQRDLDAWVQQWPASYIKVCTEEKSDNPQATAGALARQACLETQLLQVAGLVEILSQPNAAVARKAADAVERQLRAGCTAITTLAVEPEDPEARARVRKVRADLAHGRLLREMGKEQESPNFLLEVAAAARPLGLAAEQAIALRLHAQYLRDAGKLVDAEHLAEEAVHVAEAGRADDEAVHSRIELAWIVALEEGDLLRGRKLFDDAEAALTRTGRPDTLREEGLTLAAALALREGRLTEGLRLAQELYEVRQRLAGPDTLIVAQALSTVSAAERANRKFDEALDHNQRGLDILYKIVGHHHPLVAFALSARAAIFAAKHDHASALPFAEESVKIIEEDPQGQALVHRVAVYNLGLLYKRLERYPEAVARIEQALAMVEQAGSPSAETTEFLSGLAETYQQMGKLEQALDAATRSIALKEKAAGPNAASLATMYSVRGGIYVDLKRQPEAAADLKRALDLMAGPDGNPDLREVTRYDLARSLWYAKETRAQALVMVREVRAFFAAKGPNYADYVAEADGWLKAHPK